MIKKIYLKTGVFETCRSLLSSPQKLINLLNEIIKINSPISGILGIDSMASGYPPLHWSVRAIWANTEDKQVLVIEEAVV
jgi:hypothetical protein